jgi:ubiquinone/menaquinone biosynthesis C-methylase UbiE
MSRKSGCRFSEKDMRQRKNRERIMAPVYVHGYDAKEAQRLHDQATTLADLLHRDTAFPAGSTVLEAGCGVGAQTVAIAQRSPGAHITSMDLSEVSLHQARSAVEARKLSNVTLLQGDILNLDFARESFDHVFVCFVLEHLPQPMDALHALKRVLKPGGTITAIEGDHGSTFFHPDSEHARRAIQCQVTLQAKAGGDALIGRRLYPLLREAEFHDIMVSPRMVYADATRPTLVDAFTLKTFTAMIEGVRKPALENDLLSACDFDTGIAALRRASEDDGVFCYTFFKAIGRR